MLFLQQRGLVVAEFVIVQLILKATGNESDISIQRRFSEPIRNEKMISEKCSPRKFLSNARGPRERSVESDDRIIQITTRIKSIPLGITRVILPDVLLRPVT